MRALLADLVVEPLAELVRWHTLAELAALLLFGGGLVAGGLALRLAASPCP